MFDIPWATIDESWGILIEVFLLLYAFLGLAVVCEEHLVVSLTTLCHRWRIGEDVAGASFLAFGSSAPEIIINAISTLQAQTATNAADSARATSLGASAIIGSGMIAFTLIPAACGLFTSEPLLLKRRPLFRDQIFYLISLAIFISIAFTGECYLWQAASLIIVYAIYLFIIIFGSKIRRLYLERFCGISWHMRSRFDRKSKKSLLQDLRGDPAESEPLLNRERPENTLEKKSNGISRTGSSDGSMSELTEPFEKHHVTRDQWEDLTETDFKLMNLTTHQFAKFRRSFNESLFVPISFVSVTSESSQEEFFEIDREWGILDFISCPLRLLFHFTCPNCEIGQPWERWYLLTFFSSFLWVTIFSFLVSSIVERWVFMTGVPMEFFGLLLVSIGAEIPDTIESVTVAKRGFGSMAVANCLGTQVINICIGLGLPWLLTIASGKQIFVRSSLVAPCLFQIFLVFMNVMLLQGFALLNGRQKAVLDKKKAVAFVALYLLVLGSYGASLWFTKSSINNSTTFPTNSPTPLIFP